MPHHADHTATRVSDSLDNSIFGDCPSHEWRVNLHRTEIMIAINFHALAIDRNALPGSHVAVDLFEPRALQIAARVSARLTDEQGAGTG